MPLSPDRTLFIPVCLPIDEGLLGLNRVKLWDYPYLFFPPCYLLTLPLSFFLLSLFFSLCFYFFTRLVKFGLLPEYNTWAFCPAGTKQKTLWSASTGQERDIRDVQRLGLHASTTAGLGSMPAQELRSQKLCLVTHPPQKKKKEKRQEKVGDSQCFHPATRLPPNVSSLSHHPMFATFSFTFFPSPP